MRDELKRRIETALTETLSVSGHLSPPTNRLAYVLAIGEPGDELTDDEVARLLVVPDPGHARERSACAHVRRAHGRWWRRVRMGGVVRCLDAAGRLSWGEADVVHVRRTARRAVSAASLDEVPPELLPTRDRVLAQAGAIATIASAATVKRLAGVPTKAPPHMEELRALVRALEK